MLCYAPSGHLRLRSCTCPLFADSLSSALAAVALAVSGGVGVLRSELVPVDAVTAHRAASVLPGGDGLHVVRVDARLVPAEVVDHQAVGDGADVVLVGE